MERIERRRRNLHRAGVVCTILCALTIFVLSCIPGSSFPSDVKSIWSYVIHFTEYCCLGICLAFAFGVPTRDWKWVFLAVLVLGSLYGCSDELHQLLTPGRCCDWRDWLTDTCGVALGAFCVSLGLRARR